MGAKYQRRALFTSRAHAKAVGIELMKRGIGKPGFVKVHNFDTARQGLLDQLGVVAQAVVSRVCHHCQLDLGLATTGQRAGVDLGLDRFTRELRQRNRPDDA